MRRYYETVIVFDGNLNDSTISAEQEKFDSLFNSQSDVIEIAVWGKRQLAYAINEIKTGFYVLYRYEATPEILIALDKLLANNEKVLRQLTTRPDAVAFRHTQRKSERGAEEPIKEIEDTVSVEDEE